MSKEFNTQGKIIPELQRKPNIVNEASGGAGSLKHGRFGEVQAYYPPAPKRIVPVETADVYTPAIFEPSRWGYENFSISQPPQVTTLPRIPIKEITGGRTDSESAITDALTVKPDQLTSYTEAEGIAYINKLNTARDYAADNPGMEELGEALTSYDAYRATLGKEMSPKDTVKFRKSMQFYMSCFRQPLRIVETGKVEFRRFNTLKPGNTVALFDADDDWVALPNERNNHVIVAQEILDEARATDFDPYRTDQYSSTSAYAIDSILEDGALTGTEGLRRKGKLPKTGAFRAEVPEGMDIQWKDAVYASRGLSDSSYAAPGWFDDYAVTFAVDKGKQQKYILDRYSNLPSALYGYDEEGSGGQKLGPAVPLDNMKCVYTPSRYKDTLTEKLRKHDLDIPVFSVEAALLKSKMPLYFNRYKS
jgi:hypothetical protein